MNILFWNTFKKPLHKEISDLVDELKLDVIILVENNGDEKNLLTKINHYDDFSLTNKLIFQKSVILFGRKVNYINEIYGHPRFGIYEMKLINEFVINLCVVHFPSKMNWGDSDDHFGLCVELSSSLRKIENESGNKKSIIIGDFNMNPFEKGLVNSAGLGNVSVKSIAANRKAKIYNQKQEVLYNPMWNFFGEMSRGEVPGTFYYNSSKYINHYWNIFDQFMIRPELLNSFLEEDFAIITQIKNKSLLRESNNINIIDKSISDHLPLFVKLNTENNEEFMA